MNLKPLGDTVFIRRIEKKKETESGIILPGAENHKDNKGVVVAAGPGRVTIEGELIPNQIVAGDVVIFCPTGGEEMDVDGEELVVMSERDVYGIVRV